MTRVQASPASPDELLELLELDPDELLSPLELELPPDDEPPLDVLLVDDVSPPPSSTPPSVGGVWLSAEQPYATPKSTHTPEENFQLSLIEA